MKNLMMCLMFVLLTTIGVKAQKSNWEQDTNLLVCNDDVAPSIWTNEPISAPIGIEDKTAKNFKMAVYPNPATTYLTVSVNGAALLKAEKVNLQVIDMKGRIVLAMQDMMYPGNTYQKDIDVRGLPHNDYLFQFTKGNISIVKKFRIYC